jgi:hypothetical protein
MGLIMVGAAVYGVLQLALLSWPVRASRVSTILLAFVVGAYGSGVLVLVVSLAWWRIGVETGGVPGEVAESVSRHVIPPLEELAKIAPLLLAGWLGMRRQWGLADFAVLGAATGAGFGLLEALIQAPPDPASLTALDEGWMGQARLSLTAPYYASPEQVLTSWLPGATGVVEIGMSWEGTTGTSRHLLWGPLGGLAVGLLLRARSWRKTLCLPLLGATITHHWMANNITDDWPGWTREAFSTADDWAPTVATGCVVLAVFLDWRQLRWGKATVPGVLLAAEHTSRVGGLVAEANRFLPYTALAVARFTRARRHLLYAAAITRTERLQDLEPLRNAVAQATALMDHAHHHGRWDAARIRSAVKAHRAARRSRARWVLLVAALLLTLPSLLYLGIGNFPSTHSLGEWFTDSPGTTVLFACAAASLALTLVTLVLLIRAWRPARSRPLAELSTSIALRLTAAVGGIMAGAWLMWIRLVGTPMDEEVIDTDRASLFAALNNLLFGLGLALFVIGLFALFPPGGAAALATTSGFVVSGGTAISLTAAAEVLAGSAVIAYAEATSDGGGDAADSSPTTSARDVHNAVRRGERDVDEADVWQNGELYINGENGNMIKVLDRGDGTSDIVIRDPSNPSGQPITRFNAPNRYVQRRIDSGEWE